jgi:tRNA 5-methylaminomethyl-2-thiouridine biosynthesis bifunctional protein
VLDTDFADGAQFFALWRQWRDAATPGAMLHYVGLQAPTLNAQPPDADEVQLRAWTQATAGISGESGFYRLLLDGGRVSLTLCLGDPHTSLRQLALQADRVILGTACAQGGALAALVKCCQRGTHLTYSADVVAAGGVDAAALSGLGFQAGAQGDWVFAPAWQLRRSRQTPRRLWSQPQRCTVIGAGLSGTSVARALALRGWQVQVLDAQDHPAGGASGLPAGLVSPVHSADDGPVSQLTRSGCALMRQHAQALLVQGQDWAPSGAWLRPVADDPTQAAGDARHLPQAFWLQPAALVRAWLATPGITFTGRSRVDTLERIGEQWVCVDQDGLELARSEVVVVANALDAARLLNDAGPARPAQAPGWGLRPAPTNALSHPKERSSPNDESSFTLTQALAGLHPRYGAISMGASAGLAGLPAQPVQGHGNFLPSVPLAQGAMWLAGAGFDAAPAPDAQAQHHANLARLARLLPGTAATLAPQFASGQVQLWQGQRCVSHDRLPLVGAVQAAPDASLWISAAMGARGLTLAALCAELLAARLGGEPLPLPARLARLLNAQRLDR